eukprot:10593771-Alexandrium_andersonii.AAC.1
MGVGVGDGDEDLAPSACCLVVLVAQPSEWESIGGQPIHREHRGAVCGAKGTRPLSRRPWLKAKAVAELAPVPLAVQQGCSQCK